MQNSSNYCKNCGKLLNEDSEICPRCSSFMPDFDAFQNAGEIKHSSFNKLLIISLTVAIFLISIGSIWYIFSGI